MTFPPLLGLEFGEDDYREVKRARKVPLFDQIPDSLTPQVQICKLVVGGMHSLAITPVGTVYSWGCNDEGALGRPGEEDKPMLVPLEVRVDHVTAGDSHSVFCNSKQSKVYMSGLYRVSRSWPVD